MKKSKNSTVLLTTAAPTSALWRFVNGRCSIAGIEVDPAVLSAGMLSSPLSEEGLPITIDRIGTAATLWPTVHVLRLRCEHPLLAVARLSP
ncbi:hypothetical protein [Agrococcus baldri]|uniref:hypothetical protein n=1 Tax=Agrococcus baldri TaxID=153730 RepID=UPI00296EA2B8|nr:hypothetical protein [Agrococcus baldri]